MRVDNGCLCSPLFIAMLLLHLDRPFLICVKKREPGAAPFFLMWVDNSELMQKF